MIAFSLWKLICIYFKLETGAYILGALGILSNLAAVGLLGFGLVFAIYYFDDIVHAIKENVADHRQITFMLESQACKGENFLSELIRLIWFISSHDRDFLLYDFPLLDLTICVDSISSWNKMCKSLTFLI